MNKEELEKEAEEWTKDHSGLIGGYKFVKYDYDSMQKAYLAGAEPREKRIAELQHKVDTLQGNLDHDIEYDMDKTIREQKNKIADLEKVNAELKTDMATAIPLLERAKEISESLTKAKEIIKKLINACCSYGATGSATTEAEQFLNSEVEK